MTIQYQQISQTTKEWQLPYAKQTNKKPPITTKPNNCYIEFCNPEKYSLRIKWLFLLLSGHCRLPSPWTSELHGKFLAIHMLPCLQKCPSLMNQNMIRVDEWERHLDQHRSKMPSFTTYLCRKNEILCSITFCSKKNALTSNISFIRDVKQM